MYVLIMLWISEILFETFQQYINRRGRRERRVCNASVTDAERRKWFADFF
jgi:hypothetical protein